MCDIITLAGNVEMVLETEKQKGSEVGYKEQKNR